MTFSTLATDCVQGLCHTARPPRSTQVVARKPYPGLATHAEFVVPPLQCQRVIGWQSIGSDATGFLPPTATHRCHALTAAPLALRDSELSFANRTTTNSTTTRGSR